MVQATLSRLLSRSRLTAAGVLLTLLAAAPRVQAQASVTASRSLAISAFAAAEGVHPEYGGSPIIYGVQVGGDLTRYFRLASPSLEVRFGAASGSVVSQRVVQVGVKVEHAFGSGERIHPYLTGLVGPGSTHFVDPADPNYTHDTSLVLDLGAGLDCDLSRHFAVKGDFQVQRWHLGKESSVFSPENVSIGLVYRPTFGKLSIR